MIVCAVLIICGSGIFTVQFICGSDYTPAQVYSFWDGGDIGLFITLVPKVI